jgi:hypothetical protein
MPMLSTFGGGSVRGFRSGGAVAADPGEAIFTTTGSHSWTVPDGVTEISIVAVGAGGTAGRWSPNYGGVAGGDSYLNIGGVDVVVAGGGDGADAPLGSNQPSVKADGGTYSIAGGYATTSGGGDGGRGQYEGAGGGAGGYAGKGGYTGTSYSQIANTAIAPPVTNSGGAAGANRYGGGGGVGLYGKGSDGSTGYIDGNYRSGGGGSGGAAGNGYSQSPSFLGGEYGGGSGTYWSYPPGGGGGALAWANGISVTPGSTLTVYVGAGGDGSTLRNYGSPGNGPGDGANGAVRILWGEGRAFPSTDVNSDYDPTTY